MKIIPPSEMAERGTLNVPPTYIGWLNIRGTLSELSGGWTAEDGCFGFR
ncbi:MAG: hypothetical protein ACTS41_01695 [Candidatus Hodgkinia cicadicola]